MNYLFERLFDTIWENYKDRNKKELKDFWSVLYHRRLIIKQKHVKSYEYQFKIEFTFNSAASVIS